MPRRDEVCYFGAGPAPLPTAVLKAGAQAFVNYEDSGLSLAEISHRSPTATKILADTKDALIALLDIPETHEVLFMHGGGSGEFSAVVLNLLAVWVEGRRKEAEKDLGWDNQSAVVERVRKESRDHLRLDYLVTGSWSLKASQEAANLLGPLGKSVVNIVTDARQEGGGKFGCISPEETWKLTPTGGCGCAFVYYCDNETIDGVEYPGFPTCFGSKSENGGDERIVVADMSSNLLSRKVDVSKYGVIFGGAQKNIGITDLTLVIVRKDLLTTVPTPDFLHAVGIWSPPSILSWPIIAQNNSLFNTMPIFSLWIAGQVMKNLLSTHGGLAGQEAMVNAKAETIYRVLDAHPHVYQPVNEKSVRSRMNICFRLGDIDVEKRFLVGAEERLLQGLKGHRSVGGIRVSNYNAVPMESIWRLARYLEEFARQQHFSEQ